MEFRMIGVVATATAFAALCTVASAQAPLPTIPGANSYAPAVSSGAPAVTSGGTITYTPPAATPPGMITYAPVESPPAAGTATYGAPAASTAAYAPPPPATPTATTVSYAAPTANTTTYVAPPPAKPTSGQPRNEQNGKLVGTGMGALLGGVLGQVLGKDSQSVVLGAALGGMAGYFAGGQIGRNLDQRDRDIAAHATQQLLDQPLPPPPIPAAQPNIVDSVRAPAQVAQAPAPAPAVAWSSDHSDAKGTVSVVTAQQSPTGRECRTVRHVAYIKGKEVTQNDQFCRTPPAQWAAL